MLIGEYCYLHEFANSCHLHEMMGKIVHSNPLIHLSLSLAHLLKSLASLVLRVLRSRSSSFSSFPVWINHLVLEANERVHLLARS